METKWAIENLQTIRTLMERSALYRRALAPIMIYAGTVGIAGGLIGWRCQIESNRGFAGLWLGVAVTALAGALFLVRRQALVDSEPFWSPPTRRVGQALLPAFLVGFCVAIFVVVVGETSERREIQLLLIACWAWFYGCAVNAAGFFMPRGVRWLGWIFIAAGCGVLTFYGLLKTGPVLVPPHLLMGGIFGGLHLIYGIYLHFTEPKSSVA